jgi:2-polyprenyl-3-methyl-5-hydroxy-6-metoxy-1,4-benzoquinol methylase
MQSEELKKNLDQQAQEYCTWWFWEKYVGKCGDIIVPKIKGKSVLEMGCSTLVVSKMLANAARRLEIVDGAASFVEQARRFFKGRVDVTHSLFEEFEPESRYEAIVLTNTLHHLAEPRMILSKIRQWLAPDGVLYITVPNMTSLHRQIGVQMGLLPDVFGDSLRNKLFQQPGRYTKQILQEQCISCGYEIIDCYGFFLKPFSDDQMQLLEPDDRLVDALFELGKRNEDMASLLYIELKNDDSGIR